MSNIQAWLLIAGSISLVVGGFAGVLSGVLASQVLTIVLHNTPSVIGTCLYVIGNVFFLLAVINVPTVFPSSESSSDLSQEHKIRWFDFNPRSLAYVAATTGIFATILLAISTSFALVSNATLWPEGTATPLIRIPGIVGATILLFSFYIQWVEHQHHLFKWDPGRMIWWELVLFTIAGFLLVIANGLGFVVYSKSSASESEAVVQYGTNLVFLVAFWFLLSASYLFLLETINIHEGV